MEEVRQLWDGHARVQLPKQWEMLDVSKLRLVPDNQEMFVESATHAACHGDRSVIFEWIDRAAVAAQPPEEDASARLTFLWQDLEQLNDATTERLLAASTRIPHACRFLLRPEGWVRHGFLRIDVERVYFYLGLLRLPQHGTDMLMSFHWPCHTAEAAEVAAVEGPAAAERIFESFTLEDEILFA